MDGKFNIIATADAEVASGVAKKAAFDLAAVQACRQNPAGFGQLAVSHEVDEDAVGNVRMAPFVDDVSRTFARSRGQAYMARIVSIFFWKAGIFSPAKGMIRQSLTLSFVTESDVSCSAERTETMPFCSRPPPRISKQMPFTGSM